MSPIKQPSGGWLPGSFRAVSLALLCTACASQQPDDAPSNIGEPANGVAAHARHSPANGETALHLAEDGVDLVNRRTGAARHVRFGTAESAGRAAIEPTVGEQWERFHNPGCRLQPNSRLEYHGGLFLYFEGGRFVAWQQDDDAGSLYRMPRGVFPGMTREQLQRLGDVRFRTYGADPQDFTIGRVSGMLMDGKVSNFRAGHQICE
jgi:hypothetical protein